MNTTFISSDELKNSSKTLIKNLSLLFKDPVGQSVEITNDTRIVTGIQLIVINFITVLLGMIFSTIGIKLKFSNYSLFSAFSGFKYFAAAILILIPSYFIGAAILYATTKFIGKHDIDYLTALNLFSVKAVFDAVFIFAGSLITIFIPGFGTGLVLCGCGCSFILLILTYINLFEIEGTKLLITLCIVFTYVCSTTYSFTSVAYKYTVIGSLYNSILGGLLY